MMDDGRVSFKIGDVILMFGLQLLPSIFLAAVSCELRGKSAGVVEC